jgi:GAF domain-containing protein
LIGEGLGQLRVEGEAGQVWSPEDDELLQTAARLLAQRLENLRLLAQAEQYRGEAERALRRLTREGWRDYLDTAQLQPAYEYADGQVTAAPDPAPAGPLVAEPLVVQGEPVGEIGVEAEALPPEAEALVAAVAAQLSAHIENLRLGEATQLALAETEELYRITAQLNAAPAIPDVIGVLAGLNAAAAGGLFLLEADASGRPGSLVYTAGWPQPNPRLGPLGTRLPLESFPEAAYWREHPQEPLLVGDLEKDARVHAATRALYQQLGVRAAAFLPLGLAGRWTGLVTLSWLKPRAFSAQDEQVYQAAAAQAAVVINNRVLFEQTRKRADREAVINAITQRIQGTVTVQGALETAIQELGQALQARRASVALAVTPGAAGPGPDAPAANGHDGAGAEK